MQDALPMLKLERILNQDRLMRALTGLNRRAFEAEVLKDSLSS